MGDAVQDTEAQTVNMSELAEDASIAGHVLLLPYSDMRLENGYKYCMKDSMGSTWQMPQ